MKILIIAIIYHCHHFFHHHLHFFSHHHHLLFLHLHFIAHNAMFSHRKQLQPPPSNFNLLTPPPEFPSADHLFGSHVMTKEKKEEEKEKIIDEIDNKIYELPDLPKLELGDGLLNTLGQFVNP